MEVSLWSCGVLHVLGVMLSTASHELVSFVTLRRVQEKTCFFWPGKLSCYETLQMGLHLHASTFSACDCAISSLWHVENGFDRRNERCPPRNMWTNCSNLMQKEWVKLNNTVESIPSPFETGWDEYLCVTGMGEWIDEPRDLVVDHYTSADKRLDLGLVDLK